MKPIALIASVLLLASMLGAAPKYPAQVKSAIEHVLNAQLEAWNNHDLENFMQGYWHSPELTFFSGGQALHGWDEALDRYRKRYQGQGHEMGKLEFANLNILPLTRDATLVRGEWHLTTSDGKNPHGLFTLIFHKYPEGWKIIHDHTSAAE